MGESSHQSQLTSMGVDKTGTWNIPEHAGTFRNIPKHRIIMIIMKKMPKIKLRACLRDHFERSVWSRDMMFLFAGRTSLLPNERVRKNIPPWEISLKGYEVIDY